MPRNCPPGPESLPELRPREGYSISGPAPTAAAYTSHLVGRALPARHRNTPSRCPPSCRFGSHCPEALSSSVPRPPGFGEWRRQRRMPRRRSLFHAGRAPRRMAYQPPRSACPGRLLSVGRALMAAHSLLVVAATVRSGSTAEPAGRGRRVFVGGHFCWSLASSPSARQTATRRSPVLRLLS